MLAARVQEAGEGVIEDRDDEAGGDEDGEEDGEEEGEIDMDEEPSKSLKSDEFEDFMDDFEERQQTKKDLKMPEDLMGNEDDLNDYGDDFDGDEDGEEEQVDEVPENDEDIENEVFALARENKEMKGSGITFANQDMLEKIQKIEDEMMDDKKWTMKGEVECKDRNYNSLLEEFVDFDTATKLPPQVTKETTSNIESMIKQRVLDELFDDPIRKVHTSDKKQDDFTLEFTKSNKGLGDQYADDYAKKLIS